MKLLPPFCTFFAAAVFMTGVATAAEPQQIAKTATRAAAAEPARTRPQNPLQALCRVIFVDVDEGYGVTKQESRTICDEPR